MTMLPASYARLPEFEGLPRWRPRLLLVDDDISLLDGLRRRLRKHFDVVPCKNALEALYQFEQQPPDIMVVDYVLPDVDGVQITSVLTSCSIATVPAILISGHPRHTVPIGSLEASFLEKPFHADALITLIESKLVP